MINYECLDTVLNINLVVSEGSHQCSFNRNNGKTLFNMSLTSAKSRHGLIPWWDAFQGPQLNINKVSGELVCVVTVCYTVVLLTTLHFT